MIPRRAASAHERGSILLAALFIVLLVLLVVVAVTTRATLSSQAVVRAERRTLAFAAAEAALNVSLRELSRDENPDGHEGSTRHASWTVDAKSGSLDADGWERWELVATGDCRGQVQAIRLGVRVHGAAGGASVRTTSFTELPGSSR